MKLLYGHKIGQPEYTEQILCTQSERFGEVKKLAANDGFTGFRIATHTDGEKPDFATVKLSASRCRVLIRLAGLEPDGDESIEDLRAVVSLLIEDGTLPDSLHT